MTANDVRAEGRFASARWVGTGLSALSLALADAKPWLAPLCVLCLVPFIVCLSGPVSIRRGAMLGAFFGGAYGVIMAAQLGLPGSISAAMVVGTILHWGLLGAVYPRFLKSPPLPAALGIAATTTLVQYATTLLPFFGTATYLIRPLAHVPWVAAPASIVGMPGLLFACVTLAALAARVAEPSWQRGLLRLATGTALFAGITAGIHARQQGESDTVLVAAMGWTEASLEERGIRSREDRLARVYEKLVTEAASQGARVIVTPEAAITLDAGSREGTLQRMGALARGHGVALLFGYFDEERHDNRIAFFSSRGTLVAFYQKTHLIPFLEHYQQGAGDLISMEEGGLSLGGMICQDDNFTDLARRYGRMGVASVFVPTADWREVAPFHFSNSIFRAIENRYSVVRATLNGTSAIVAQDGRLLRASDHFQRGPEVIVASIAVARSGSVYSQVGDAPVLTFAALCLVALGIQSRRAHGRASVART